MVPARAFLLRGLCCALLAGSTGCAALGTINLPPEQLKAKYGTADDRTFEHEGMQVRYRDEGAGPVVILLHGVCSSLETWDGWVQALKGELRVVRLDIPGFGLTGPARDPSAYSREGAVAFLHAFAAHLGVQRFSIAGNSLGGYIAWTYAVAHPEKVEKLVLLDPVAYHQKMPGLLSFASHPLIRPFARVMMPRRMIEGGIAEAYGDPSRLTAEVKARYFDLAMRAGNKSSYVDVFTVLRRENDSPTLSVDIPRIQAPTLLMFGAKDAWVPPEQIERWRRDLPGLSVVTFEGLGHVPMEEAPAATAEAALRFLRAGDRGCRGLGGRAATPGDPPRGGWQRRSRRSSNR